MGKTKTFIVEGQAEDKTSGKDAYAAKMLKRAQAAAVLSGGEGVKNNTAAEAGKTKEKTVEVPVNKNDQKAKNKDKGKLEGLGLKGGERIKVIGGDLPEEVTTTTGAETSAQADTVVENKRRKLKVRSKNYKSAYAKVNKEKLYKIADAIKLLKDIKFSKFDETLEMHITTKSSPLNVNATLPHSTGKQKIVEVASEATIEKLKAGKVDFDVLVATADMMPKLVPFARILGPKGMMPNPKNGTLIKNAKEADKFGGNAINLKTQKDANAIHTVAGKLSMKDSDLEDNIKAIIDAITDKQIVKLFLKSTMSPSVKVQT